MSRSHGRTAAGYLIGLVLLTLYGGVVCPLMQGFGTPILAAIISAGLLAAFVVEVVDGRRRPDVDPVRRWTLQWALWVLPGIAVFVSELASGHPPFIVFESSMKMVVAALTFGFYSSSWVSLDLEHEWFLIRAKQKKDGPSQRFVSIASRVERFAQIGFAGMGVVLLLLLVKSIGQPTGRGLVGEVAFVLGVMIVSLTLIAGQYRRNFALLYRFEEETLQAVRAGRFDVRVPLLSSDEFRKIAEGTNDMIDGLREREEIRVTYGKYFSPEVARRIRDRGAKLGGEQIDITVLFTDLRNYTALSERLTPEQVVSVLNEYFTMVVGVLTRNHGALDKFIGDAAMATFGLESGSGGCESAVKAAFEIHDELILLRERMVARGLPALDNGIGIHHGPVIAGNIGSAERLEYTVIGDSVNIASRLESLTKSLGTPIAITEEVFKRLSPELQARLAFVGEHELKGKELRLKVYGLSATAIRAATNK